MIKDSNKLNRRPTICLSLACETLDEIGREYHKFRDYCGMIELRADYLAGIEKMGEVEFTTLLKTVKNLAAGKSMIVAYHGEEEIGNRLLRWSLGIANYIDVPYVNSQRNSLIRMARRKGTEVIISCHNYTKMPPKGDIVEMFLRMELLDCALLKIACQANKEDDLYVLLESAGAYHSLSKSKPIIAVAMGEAGQASRICAGDFGSVISYGCGSMPTAPGQINCIELSEYMDRYYK